MKLTSLFTLLAFSATAFANVPLVPQPQVACDCRGERYNVVETAGAIAKAAVTAGGYPHSFQNKEGFRFKTGCYKPYQEYPLTHGAPYKNGDLPGKDRVIYSTPTHNTTKFCGCITHRGAQNNDFNVCVF